MFKSNDKFNNTESTMNDRKAYIIGNGLASISTAFYLTRESDINPKNVYIFDNVSFDGGSLDAFDYTDDNYYFMRGFRMLEENVYSAVFDLMSKVPLPGSENKTLKDDFDDFNKVVKTYSVSRLVEKGKAINARKFTLKLSDSIKILVLLATPEHKLQNVTIADFFSTEFFKSNFWAEFATTFSFQPWHSAEEMKRYILRFIQCSPVLDSQTCIRSTRYNQMESLVLPVKAVLEKLGVNFVYNTAVTDIDFFDNEEKLSVNQIHTNSNGKEKVIEVKDEDYVFMSLGSMTACYSVGSMAKAPAAKTAKMEESVDWMLWKKLAIKHSCFGKPEVFGSDTLKSRWVSFTITFTDNTFCELLEEITKTTAGKEGPITIKDSNWLIAFALPYNPHFKNQPKNMRIVWGYGMFADKPGNFVNKPMADCKGEEILYEIIHHLRFERKLKEIIKSAVCIPCMLPFITSQFMPRNMNDRPKIVPKCSKNFAIIGQYCEIPEDIVFTLEYSVRSAQIAVYTMLGKPEKVTPIFKGWHRLKYLFGAFRTVFR